MQVTMTMEEYTNLITANAKQVEQLNKMMEKYDNINKERYELLKSQNNKGCQYCNELKSLYHCKRIMLDMISELKQKEKKAEFASESWEHMMKRLALMKALDVINKEKPNK